MNIKSKLVVVGISILLSNCNGVVQKPESSIAQSVDAIVAPYIHPDGPGVSLLVIEKGNVLIRKGYGLASLELDVENDPDMIYKIGSLTKQFTATAILKLEEEGQLSIQDDIRKYVPEYPDHGAIITIEHLLNHTSGIPSFTDRVDISDIEKTDLTPEQILALFVDEPLEFPSGEKYSYSDSGYILLGLIIERLSGVTYEEFITQNLFSIADLNNTYCGNPENLIPNRASGYSLDSMGYKPAQYMTMKVPYAAGNIISNVDDLYSWTQSLHSGEIISKEQLSKMFTSAKISSRENTGYGLGTFVKTFSNQPVYFHDGWIYGYISSQFYFPESDIFVVVLSNSTSIDSHEIASKIAARLFNMETSLAIDQLKWY